MCCSNSGALTKFGIWLPKFNLVWARPFSFQQSCGVIPKWEIKGSFCEEMLGQFCKLCQISSWVAEQSTKWPGSRRLEEKLDKCNQCEFVSSHSSLVLYDMYLEYWNAWIDFMHWTGKYVWKWKSTKKPTRTQIPIGLKKTMGVNQWQKCKQNDSPLDEQKFEGAYESTAEDEELPWNV